MKKLCMQPLRFIKNKTHLALAMSLLMVSVSDAGIIRSGTFIGSSYGAPFTGWEEENLVNKSGLSVGFTDGDDFATAVAANTHTGNDGWLRVNEVVGTLDFDLGSEENLTSFAIWNTGFSASADAHNIREFSVLTDTAADFSSATNVGSFTNERRPGSSVAAGPYFPTIFDLADSQARYVRIAIASNNGSASMSSGEFAFELGGAAGVPEPSSCMLLSGMAGLVLLRRRQRKTLNG